MNSICLLLGFFLNYKMRKAEKKIFPDTFPYHSTTKYFSYIRRKRSSCRSRDNLRLFRARELNHSNV